MVANVGIHPIHLPASVETPMADLLVQEVQNLDGLGANFATQFCWAGMYGGRDPKPMGRWEDEMDQ